MIRACTAGTIRALEERAMSALGDDVLMQRAAGGLAAVLTEELRRRSGTVYGAPVLILVGPGNNGGDALFAGARLASRGARVWAVSPDDAGKPPHPGGGAAFEAAGGVWGRRARADMVIDGLLGTGAHGGLREPAAALVASLE